MVMLKWQFSGVFHGQGCTLYQLWSESKICEVRFILQVWFDGRHHDVLLVYIYL